MGQWYTSTIILPEDEELRKKVITILEFTSVREYYSWECSTAQWGKFFWISGNELVEQELQNLIEDLNNFLRIELQFTIRLEDDLYIQSRNAQGETINNILGINFFVSYKKIKIEDLFEFYEERFGDRDEYLALFLYDLIHGNYKRYYKVEIEKDNLIFNKI